MPEQEELEKEKITYRSKKRSSLFRFEYKDGSIEYIDVNRCYCTDISNNAVYSSSYVNRIIHKIYPITMPYKPLKDLINVYFEEFLFDKNNEYCDTIGIFSIIEDGKKIEVNRFFKDTINGLIEIQKDEYDQRKVLSKLLQA